ncbi:MAG TPA: response regulator [Thermoplasmata archaeon]|nr:response regulator [Thermoplasmata archaeon]
MREYPAPLHILLAEDNPADVRLMRELLKESTIVTELHVVSDGEEAVAYMRKRGKYVDAPRPNLVLLDLNMPKRDGRSVLREVKADPELKRIPVIVLTTSGAEEDIRQSYDAHANCYVRKPTDFADFQTIFQKFETFWFTAAEIPTT